MKQFFTLVADPVPLDKEARAAAEDLALKEEEKRSDEFLARLLEEAERIKNQ